jgi:hypothetical protein
VEVIALIGGSELHSRIEAVDDFNRIATLRTSANPLHFDADPRYWIENDPEGVDSPGEWHLSRITGALSYKPLPKEDIKSVEAIVPTSSELIVLDGDPIHWRFVRNLHFRGISFSYTSCAVKSDDYVSTRVPIDGGAAITARGALNCSIEDCSFSRLGGYAVSLGSGCKQYRVVGNEMSDLGGGGIRIGSAIPSPNSEEHTSDNTITDNRIRGCGRIHPSSPAVWIGYATRTTVSYNEIFDTHDSAIMVGCSPSRSPEAGKSHQVDSNHLYRIGKGVMGKVAAIRILGRQPGTILSGNLIHDVTSHGYGGFGIHADDGCEEVVVEDNLVYSCKGAALSLGRVRDLRVTNNIFAMNHESQLVRGGPGRGRSLTFHRNVVCWSQGKLLGYEWDDSDCSFEENLYWKTGGREFQLGRWSFNDWQKRGQDKESKIADPLFVNLSGNDFTVRPESPALKLGFEPVDYGAVGPRPKDFRGSVQTASASR